MGCVCQTGRMDQIVGRVEVGVGEWMDVHTEVKKVNSILCNLKKHVDLKIEGFGYK